MSDDNDVWAVDDWVPADMKRRSTRALATVLTLTIIGGGLYLAGIVTIRSALGWPLFVSGLLVLLAVIVLVTAANPYRRVSGDAELPRHIFHLSPERWDEGATVTLAVQRCRKKQFIAENRPLGNDTPSRNLDDSVGEWDAASVVFPVDGQPEGASVSEGGKTLTVPGQGVYTIDEETGLSPSLPSRRSAVRRPRSSTP